MKPAFLVAIIAPPILSIAVVSSYPTPAAAQDNFRAWSPAAKLGPLLNSEHIKKRPVVFREEEDEEEEHNRCTRDHFGPFSDWSDPRWLGPTVNSSADDFHPAISHNGLSLYITSARTAVLDKETFGFPSAITSTIRGDRPRILDQISILPTTNSHQNSRPMGTGCSSAEGCLRKSGFRIARMRMTISVGGRQ